VPRWFRKSAGEGSEPRIEYDAAAVEQALRLAVGEALQVVSASAPGECLYGLSVYEGIEHGYICITPFTDEGLERVLDEHRRGRWADDYQTGDAAEGLRWSAPDSPFHAAAAIDCPPLVSGEDQYRLWQSWDQDDAPLRKYRDEVRELCFTTLETMDREGRFEALRPHLTLLVQDRDERESADELDAIRRRLNPD
jgi:hypothetical protein